MTDESRYDWISELVDGRLTGSELESAQRELAENAEAQQLHQQFLANRETLQALPRLKLDAQFSQRVMQQIHAANAANRDAVSPPKTAATDAIVATDAAAKPARHERVSWRLSWRVVAGSISALAALVLAGFFIFSTEDDARPVADNTFGNATENAIVEDDPDAAMDLDDESNDSLQDLKQDPKYRAATPAERDQALSVNEESVGSRRSEKKRKAVVYGSEARETMEDFARARANPFPPRSVVGKNSNRRLQQGIAMDALAVVDLTNRQSQDIVRILTDSGITFASQPVPGAELHAEIDSKVKHSKEQAELIGQQEGSIDRASAAEYELVMIEAPATMIQQVIDTFGKDTQVQVAHSTPLSGLLASHFADNHRVDFTAEKTVASPFVQDPTAGDAPVAEENRFKKIESGKAMPVTENDPFSIAKGAGAGSKEEQRMRGNRPDQPSDQPAETAIEKKNAAPSAKAVTGEELKQAVEAAGDTDALRSPAIAHRYQISPARLREIRLNLQQQELALGEKDAGSVGRRGLPDTSKSSESESESEDDGKKQEAAAGKSSAAKPVGNSAPSTKLATAAEEQKKHSPDAAPEKSDEENRKPSPDDSAPKRPANVLRQADKLSSGFAGELGLKQLESEQGTVRLMIILNRSHAAE